MRHAPTQAAESEGGAAFRARTRLRDGDLEVERHRGGAGTDHQHPEGNRNNMVDGRHESDGGGDCQAAHDRP